MRNVRLNITHRQMAPQHGNVEVWIFDLDNTLYPPSAALFDEIHARMSRFISARLGLAPAEADALRREYWRRHGTTLAGLMRHHRVEPGDFLAEVHAVDLSALRPDPGLARRIAALPGRKLVHTNASRAHAGRVLAARGLAGVFDAVYAIEAKGYVPKPDPRAFRLVVEAAGIAPACAVMIEDDMRNLRVPKALGMTTVWIRHEARTADEQPPVWVDHHAPSIGAALDLVAPSPGATTT